MSAGARSASGPADAPALPPRPLNPAPVWVSALVALAWLATRDLGIGYGCLVSGFGDMVEYAGRYGRPNFSELSTYLGAMGVTLATALWGTAFALLIAVPLAPLAARNFSPHPAAYRLSREFFNTLRAIPDMVLALVFVAALGLGPLPGALALGVHTAGFLGKFLAETLERVDEGVLEGIASTGADIHQTVLYAGWPSILREGIGYSLFLLDRNVRMASVLGMVGAGGIGLILYDSLRLFNYDQSAAMILVILASLLAIDQASAWLRRRLT